LFAKHGARVVVSDRDEGPASNVAEEIASRGLCDRNAGDVTDPEFPRRLRKTVANFAPPSSSTMPGTPGTDAPR
jgi:3-oxoacyl-[acyl-carrier protein] reductase